MEYEIPEELLEAVRGLVELYDIAYEGLEPVVNNIIKKRIVDINYIEHVLDDIMNIPTDKAYKLFILLCEYVATFNKEVAEEYIDIYNDIYGDDNSTYTKK